MRGAVPHPRANAVRKPRESRERGSLAIEDWHDAVKKLMGSGFQPAYAAMQALMRLLADIERITTHVTLGSARARDLAGLRDSRNC